MARSYESREINVVAMSQVGVYRWNLSLSRSDKVPVQYDMTAWVKRGTREQVGVITDFTDAESVLGAFLGRENSHRCVIQQLDCLQQEAG